MPQSRPSTWMELPFSIASPTPMVYAATSPRTTLPSVSTAIEQIEQKISHHAQIIIDLKIERNSLLPVSQLPVEVLCKIFRCAQQSYDKNNYAYPYSFHKMGISTSWMAVTRVCHYWRNAALNETLLWTEPLLMFTKWTSVFLERSRMAGVTLSFVDERFSTPLSKLLTTVVPHIPHTTTLVIKGMRRRAMDMVFKYLSSMPAPMLTTLLIDGTTAPKDADTWSDLEDDDYTSVSLPKKLFAKASMLRHLSLNSIEISWKSHLLSGLTELKLENIPENARPTPQEFLLALGRNFALRSLTLKSALPTTGTLAAFTSNNRRRIPLRSLETLEITSEAPACEFLCNHIALSGGLKKINMDLQYGITQSGQVQACRILSALDEADIGQPLDSSIRHVKMTGNIPDLPADSWLTHNLTFQTNSSNSFHFEDDISAVLDTNEVPLDLQVRMSRNPLAAHEPDMFSDFFQALSWDNLSNLDIHALEIDRPEFHVYLAASFGALRGLRAVSVGKSSVNCLIDALLLNWDKDPALVQGSVSFPALHHIGFDDISFGTVPIYRMGVKVEHLMDCLMNRCERRVPIHSISMKNCIIFGTEDRRLLEEIVVNIHWDDCQFRVYDYYPSSRVDPNDVDDFDSDYYCDDAFA